MQKEDSEKEYDIQITLPISKPVYEQLVKEIEKDYELSNLRKVVYG